MRACRRKTVALTAVRRKRPGLTTSPLSLRKPRPRSLARLHPKEAGKVAAGHAPRLLPGTAKAHMQRKMAEPRAG